MTVPAAKGLLQNVFWKPEMEWEIIQIHLLAPIRFASIMTNEISNFPESAAIRKFLKSGEWNFHAGENRMQRRSVVLIEPHFGIIARAVVKPGVDARPIKYESQFDRRVVRGGFWKDPYLGVREFQAEVAPLDMEPIDVTMDLGMMPYSIDYSAVPSPCRWKRFRLEHGVMEVGDADRETS